MHYSMFYLLNAKLYIDWLILQKVGYEYFIENCEVPQFCFISFTLYNNWVPYNIWPAPQGPAVG